MQGVGWISTPTASIDVRIDEDGSVRGGHDLGRDAPEPGARYPRLAPAADGNERGPQLLGGFEEHAGRVAAREPDFGLATEEVF